jgi:hypothetical protein
MRFWFCEAAARNDLKARERRSAANVVATRQRRRRLRQHRQQRLRTSKARLADRSDQSSIEKIDYFGFVLPKLDFVYF